MLQVTWAKMLSFLMAVQTDFIFRRYSVDGGEDCKKFALVPAWYYDRSNEDCQPYKVCANKDILFHERCGFCGISSSYVFPQNYCVFHVDVIAAAGCCRRCCCCCYFLLLH